MATFLKNLSEYNPAQLPARETLAQQCYAVAVADWNSNVTFAMLRGAVETFLQNGVREEKITIMHVPGTFELTYACSKLQQSAKYTAIVAIGCVIRGDTPHFDCICQGVTYGIASLNAKGTTPVVFSVLTTENLQQALDRAGGKDGNKGIEGAVAAMQTGNLGCE
ncbi:MAG: 6,7-dimethyl-8-ribityllumazine synthase [Prevotellaceae bacterium]|nr:6,7-dimethyl-8-ribityllumazine synthase [Prevotellaceae bacterium]